MEPTIALSVAVKMSGKSPTTVRRWAKERLVQAEKDHRGSWRFDSQSLKTFLATGAAPPVRHGASTEPSDTRDPSTVELIRSLQNTLHRERQINDDLREQNRKLQADIVQLTHELKAELSKDDKGLLSRWLRST